jgi:opacity protein-like surface antigen
MKRLAALAFLLAASPALAQRTELALLAGYTSAGSIDKTAVGIQSLEVGGGFTWGLQAGRFFSRHVGAEVSWARQESQLVISTSSGSTELFDVKVGQLHGNVVYQLGAEEAPLKPFLFAGLGATFFSAPDLDGETKLSWGVGAGLKWFPRKSVGARLQARYNPTQLNDESSDFCDPFGFCQGSLQQFEVMGGVVFRF